ncbi:MAG TPA: hypothetical protein PK201_00910 [Accumulibacter sp.]|nr:hypothetical protein [Accumulibacter sp.]
MRSAAMLDNEAVRGPNRNPIALRDAGIAACREAEEGGIELAIDAGKLYQLLVCGAVSVTDFRCLDHVSKCRVRTLCLHACAHRLNEDVAGTA